MMKAVPTKPPVRFRVNEDESERFRSLPAMNTDLITCRNKSVSYRFVSAYEVSKPFPLCSLALSHRFDAIFLFHRESHLPLINCSSVTHLVSPTRSLNMTLAA